VSERDKDRMRVKYGIGINEQGGDSQNFLCKFIIFFVTLGLKILTLFRLKVVFETDIIKG